nr:hypothetical protein GCM10010200_073220 [Actinomadura rugatobispora]
MGTFRMPEFRGRHTRYRMGERTILRRIQNQSMPTPSSGRVQLRRASRTLRRTGDDATSFHSPADLPTPRPRPGPRPRRSALPRPGGGDMNVGSAQGIAIGCAPRACPRRPSEYRGTHVYGGAEAVMPVLSVTPESSKEPAP